VKAIAIVALLAGAARADDAEQTYHVTMAVADVAAAAVLIGAPIAAKTNPAPVAAVAALPYLAVGPIVHGAHGNGSAAGTSVLVRLGGPLAGMVVAYVGFRCGSADPDASCSTVNESVLVLGAMGGAVAAAVVDNVWFARKPGRSAWTPTMAPTAGGATFGLARRW